MNPTSGTFCILPLNPPDNINLVYHCLKKWPFSLISFVNSIHIVFIWVLELWRDILTKATAIQDNQLGLDYRVRSSVPYHHGEQLSAFRQSSYWRRWEFYFYVLKGRQKTNFQEARRNISKPTSTVTHFLQHGHTYSNKATYPSNATI